jgi:tetratricopeptide (TPR) repeat protein
VVVSPDYSIRQVAVHYPYFSGKKRWEQTDDKSAQDWFTHAVHIGFDMEWLHANIGSLFSRRGNIKLAEQYYRQSYQLNSYFPYTLFGLGYLSYVRKNYPEAIDYFTRAVNLKRDYAEAYYNLGAVLLESGNKYQAINALNKYLQLVPDSPQAESVRKIVNEL